MNDEMMTIDEVCHCDWCGRTVELQETTDGYCPECDTLNADRDEAAEVLATADDEVQRLKAELADALETLRAARQTDQRASKRLDKVWMTRTND